jgi:putative transcriptional regulator
MTPRHHPADETLMALAAGTLGAGPRLVVSIHVDGCRHCRDAVRTFEAVGGALLEATEPAPVSAGALDALFARIDAEDAAPKDAPSAFAPVARAAVPPMTPDGVTLPASLAGHTIGRWRNIGSTLRWARIDINGDRRANVVLLRIPASRSVPRHGHTGREFTQVLVGGFSDGRDAYLTGDLIEADEHIDHQPIVDADGECLCIAAVEGRLRIHGIGRLLQPFIGL